MTKKIIKVAMLTDYPLNDIELANGGVINAAYWLIQGLSKLENLNLIVLVPHSKIDKETVQEFGNTKVIYFPRKRRHIDPFMMYTSLQNRVNDFLGIEKPDLIHAQGNPEYLLTAVRSRLPHIVTVHGIFQNESLVDRASKNLRNFFKSSLSLKIEKYYLPRIKNLIAITDEIIEVVRSVNDNFCLFRINNPINDIFFNIQDTSSVSPKIILFIAAIRQRKGLHVLIDSYKRLLITYPDLELHVIGREDWDEDYVNELKNTHHVLVEKGSITFFGNVPLHTVIDEYSKCAVFCLPSFAESQPMVIIQSLAAGKPVVATNVGGIPQMISNGITGYLVSPGDIEMTYVALHSILCNDQKCKEMAKAAKWSATQLYAPAQVAFATFKAYSVVVNGANS